MNSRIPLIAAVVGALLVGGATTGTTHASWVDQAPLNGRSVASGRLSYTATTPAGVAVDKVAGSTADTTFVLDDTSLGKNLSQRITATVSGTPTGVTASIGTSCPGAGSVSVDTTPTSPDRTLCVRVTSSTTAVSGNVTVSLSSAQRPVAGWTTPTITRTIPVTVTTPAPSAPTLACGSPATNSHSFTWAAASGATSYTVFRSNTTNADASYSAVLTGTTATSYTAAMSNNQTSYFRVKAVNGSGSSAYSNTVRIVRSGQSVGCALVTP